MPRTRNRVAGKTGKDYRHKGEGAILRPESGAQGIFPASKHKSPKTYRHDSSISPEMHWDDNPERDEGEKLIAEILEADSLEKVHTAARKLKKISTPFLQWSGKMERSEFTVPSLPLFVHERISTMAVLNTLERHKRSRSSTLELFGEGEKTIGAAISGAYEHLNGWQNRLIHGDSLQVMNSLLQYEQMGGKVQMVYMDPPYGIKFGGNFMPFVRRRDVEDGKDNSLTREPEMVRAYRDTWTLGTHSWLTYMRDRLLLVREMLADSGSCFVQISDENVHLVRSVMDEVFGAENFVSLITYKTTSGLGSQLMSTQGDYLVWYAKNRGTIKYRQLFVSKSFGEGTMFTKIVKANGEDRNMNEREMQGFIESGDRPYRLSDIVSSGLTPSCVYDFEFEGRSFRPGRSKSWKTNLGGMQKLQNSNRLRAPGNSLQYVAYWHDFPVSSLANFWTDVVGEYQKSYVVQTARSVVQRCMLMTTDPGDLVFDPTCGSGTTAYVAEKWGRRWITADISRVPLALARQRLLTASFNYYELKDKKRGPVGGFVYEQKQNRRGEEVGGIVPHVTLKSITNDEEPEYEVLVDKPKVDSDFTRVSGPFCVEAVMPPPPRCLESSEDPSLTVEDDNHLTRMRVALLQSPELRLPGGQSLALANIRTPARSMNLHAEAETTDREPVAVMFGAPDSAVSEHAAIEAAKEARHKKFTRLLVIAFAVEPAARQTIEAMESVAGIPATYVQASTDIVMDDLLRNQKGGQLFAICGLPDVRLFVSNEKGENDEPLYQIQLLGLDTFDPVTMGTDHRSGEDVPCWMLDPDYDGQCFRAGQVFFPRTSAWDDIKKSVKVDFAESVWKHLAGDTSAPFPAGEHRLIAVKVIDDRGNELMVVKPIDEAGE